MTRWLILVLGLSIVAGTLYWVLPEELPQVSAAPPGEFDATSRANLERVLREADRAPASR
ncbi:MAG: hypothetical protein V3T07_00360 [Myxococcota bacterium]